MSRISFWKGSEVLCPIKSTAPVRFPSDMGRKAIERMSGNVKLFVERKPLSRVSSTVSAMNLTDSLPFLPLLPTAVKTSFHTPLHSFSSEKQNGYTANFPASFFPAKAAASACSIRMTALQASSRTSCSAVKFDRYWANLMRE